MTKKAPIVISLSKVRRQEETAVLHPETKIIRYRTQCRFGVPCRTDTIC